MRRAVAAAPHRARRRARVERRRALPQQRRGGGALRVRGMGAIANPDYDGAFMFCRIMFRNASNGDGGGWSVD